MNDFASTENQSGLLKNSYSKSDALKIALKRKRLKMAAKLKEKSNAVNNADMINK